MTYTIFYKSDRCSYRAASIPEIRTALEQGVCYGHPCKGDYDDIDALMEKLENGEVDLWNRKDLTPEERSLNIEIVPNDWSITITDKRSGKTYTALDKWGMRNILENIRDCNDQTTLDSIKFVFRHIDWGDKPIDWAEKVLDVALDYD